MTSTSEQAGLDWKTKRKEAAAYVQTRCDISPQIGMFLGSGLGDLADEITNATVIPYHEIRSRGRRILKEEE